MSKLFIEWVNDRGIAVPDFIKGIKKPHVHNGRVVYYTEEEIAKLLEAAGRNRIAITIVLGAYAGMLRTEIYNADWCNVDWDGNVITVHGTKTHEDRDVPMAPTLRKVLRSHWRGQRRGRVIGELTEARRDARPPTHARVHFC